MNALNDLYNAPRSSLKRKLSRKRAETKDATQADEPQEAPKVLGPYANLMTSGDSSSRVATSASRWYSIQSSKPRRPKATYLPASTTLQS
jgi:hypothetical protein